MGCASSSPVKEPGSDGGIAVKDAVGAAGDIGGGSGKPQASKGAGHSQTGPSSPNGGGTYTDDPKKQLPPGVEAALKGATKPRGVSFAGDVRDTPSRKDKEKDEDTDSPSRAVSISGRPR